MVLSKLTCSRTLSFSTSTTSRLMVSPSEKPCSPAADTLFGCRSRCCRHHKAQSQRLSHGRCKQLSHNSGSFIRPNCLTRVSTVCPWSNTQDSQQDQGHERRQGGKDQGGYCKMPGRCLPPKTSFASPWPLTDSCKPRTAHHSRLHDCHGARPRPQTGR